jgi:hypothetical protein
MDPHAGTEQYGTCSVAQPPRLGLQARGQRCAETTYLSGMF